MPVYFEAAESHPSREDELRNEVSHLEETVKEQADIIEDLKKKLVENAKLDESEILTTNNKISLQETRILKYTINELREAMEKAKEETVIVRGLLESEKQLCRSRGKELEEKCRECEALSEELKKVKVELKTARKVASKEIWAEKEQVLRKQYQIQVAEGQNKIAALNAKIRCIREREIALREEIQNLQKQLEKAQMDAKASQESAKQHFILADKQIELNIIRKQLEEVIKNEQTKDTENRDLAMAAHIEKVVEELKRLKEIASSDSQMGQIQNELGSLRATKVFLEKQAGEAEETTKQLNEHLIQQKVVVEEQKTRIAELEEKLADCEKNAEITHRYLLDDISKVKQAKAKLRCEYLQLRRQYNRLLSAQGEPPLESLSVTMSTNEDFGICSECTVLKKELYDLKNRLKVTTVDKAVEVILEDEAESKDSDMEVEIQKDMVERMRKEMEQKDAKIAEFNRTLRVLDEQCERFLKLKKSAEANCEKAIKQLDVLKQQMDETKRELERRVQVDIDIDLLRQEKERLTKKVVYLSEELRETHTDYREELAVLAKKLNDNKQKDDTESETYAAKLEQLRAEKRQMETTMRSLERQLGQLQEETGQRAKEVDEARADRTKLTEENNKLREGLAVAISKAEKYKDDAESSKELLNSLKEDLKKIKEEKCDAEVLIEQLNQTIAERERLAAYLQSQIRMKSATKLKKSSSRSTLMSSSDISVNEGSTDAEAFKPRNVGNGGDEKDGVALLRDSYSVGNDSATLSRSCLSRQNRSMPVPSAPTYIGTMKHDIPHRWKTYLVLKQAKCVVCLEGLPRVRHALKCAECGVLVHRGCSKNISNTCGLPSACADFYLDAQSSALNTMSGWIKLWRANDHTCNKWHSAWATMDERSIRFYDSDCLPSANTTDSPFLQLNLNHDQWRLHMQSVADVGVKGNLSKDSYALLIEIRMADDSLFLLAPTPQAKERWVRALQQATNKKMFIQRQQSSSADGNSMLLGLDAPLNLSINCAQVLNDWLLIGAQEGLFITSLNSLRVPFVVTGLTAVFHMEFLPELQMLIVISGTNRQLYALHATDVYSSFNSDRPTVRPTVIANYTACHLMTVLKDSSQKIRWLCVADPDHLHVLQFSSRLGIFSPFKSLPTSEPAMCLLSVPDGFVFGTDQFYYVNINELVARPLVVLGCAPDWPLAALLINEDELLLAYHNYGVFTDIQGNRTRVENIDWNRAPLEFVYSAPYLYVVHYETLEILRVADYVGPNTRCLLDEREVYRCQSAHHLGRGRTKSEILFALSAKDRTEVHCFTRPFEKRMLPTTLKRKQAADTDLLNSNSDKRCKK